MALKAFPAPTNASAGIGRILIRKSYLDPAAAVKSLEGLTREELFRLIGQVTAEPLKQALFASLENAHNVDLALFVVVQSYSFNSGYSVGLADVAEGKNLHAEYEQSRSASPAS